jgi:probable rRNA maturation factor
MSVRLAVQVACDRGVVPSAALFSKWLNSAFDSQIRGEVALRIVDTAEGAELNRTYRGKDAATNVLAFPCEDDFSAYESEPPLGDIVICADVVAREAQAQRKLPEAHWAHLTVHGALHLQGYDHETDADAERMETREREIMRQLGYPDPYESLAPASAALQDRQQ